MADRKVRFALVVMAGINVGLFVLTTRPEMVALGNAPLQGWLGFDLLAYALVGAYFLLQAVEALRRSHGLAVVTQEKYAALYGGTKKATFDVSSTLTVVSVS